MTADEAEAYLTAVEPKATSLTPGSLKNYEIL
jgi:hypothetical protein